MIMFVVGAVDLFVTSWIGNKGIKLRRGIDLCGKRV